MTTSAAEKLETDNTIFRETNRLIAISLFSGAHISHRRERRQPPTVLRFAEAIDERSKLRAGQRFERCDRVIRLAKVLLV